MATREIKRSGGRSGLEQGDRGYANAELKGRRFGRVLTKLGVVTRAQVHEALAIQRSRKAKGELDKIGAILIEQGRITEDDRHARRRRASRALTSSTSIPTASKKR